MGSNDISSSNQQLAISISISIQHSAISIEHQHSVVILSDERSEESKEPLFLRARTQFNSRIQAALTIELKPREQYRRSALLFFSEPSEQQIDRFLAHASSLEFSYSELRATNSAMLPPLFNGRSKSHISLAPARLRGSERSMRSENGRCSIFLGFASAGL